MFIGWADSSKTKMQNVHQTPPIIRIEEVKTSNYEGNGYIARRKKGLK